MTDIHDWNVNEASTTAFATGSHVTTCMFIVLNSIVVAVGDDRENVTLFVGVVR